MTNLTKISKARAKRFYDNGSNIILNPCKMRLENPWTEPFKVCKDDTEGRSFTSMTNEFEYYNCNNEQGTYIHYYIDFELED